MFQQAGNAEITGKSNQKKKDKNPSYLWMNTQS